jgi:uncharacterized protein (TIGR02611 family)
MATATLRDHLRDIKRGRPGHRFEDHYRHEKHAKRGRSSKGRVLRLALGLVSVIVGLILCVIPGPGLPFIFIGGGLLAAESLIVARVMDWLELRVRAVLRWAKRHWARMNGWQRVGVVIVGACLSAAGAYLSWRLMFG